MKKSLLLAALWASVTASFGQFNTTLNQNVVAEKLFGIEPQSYLFPQSGTPEKVTIQKHLTGKKDLTGADIAYFSTIHYGKGDTMYLVPDNMILPVYYVQFQPSAVAKPRIDNEGRRVGSTLYTNNMRYFLVDSKQGTFYNHYNAKHYFKDLKKRETDISWAYNVLSANKEMQKADFGKLWGSIDQYYANETKDLLAKTYDQHLAEFDGKTIFFMRGTPASSSGKYCDKARVSFTKGENGKLVEMKLSFPFLDGNYYDKPTLNLTITKGANGLFQIKDKSRSDMLGNAIGYLVPFGGGLLIMEAPKLEQYGIGAPESRVNAVMFDDIWKAHLTFPLELNAPYLNDDREKGVSSIYDDNSNVMDNYYKDWWKEKNLEISHVEAKDTRNFSIFLNAYWPEVLKTAK